MLLFLSELLVNFCKHRRVGNWPCSLENSDGRAFLTQEQIADGAGLFGYHSLDKFTIVCARKQNTGGDL